MKILANSQGWSSLDEILINTWILLMACDDMNKNDEMLLNTACNALILNR